MSHTEEIKNAAIRILAVAQENLVVAKSGMEDLVGLVEDQQQRIDTLNEVIAELSKLELKHASNDQR